MAGEVWVAIDETWNGSLGEGFFFYGWIVGVVLVSRIRDKSG